MVMLRDQPYKLDPVLFVKCVVCGLLTSKASSIWRTMNGVPYMIGHVCEKQFCRDQLDRYDHCSECLTFDGTVVPCDYCGKFICIEHDDKPGNRGFDSDLTLCVDDGDKFDKKSEACQHDVMEFTLNDGSKHRSCRNCDLQF